MSNVGLLREKVTFYRRSTTPDGYGNQLGTWSSLVGPVSARIMPLKGGEQVLQERLSGVNLYQITVRSSAAIRGVTTEDRAVNTRTGEEYNLTSIQNPDERKIWQTFLAKSNDAET